MKFGFSSSIYDQYQLSVQEIIARGRKIGFGGLELNANVLPKDLDVPRIKRALDDNAFEVAAVGTKNVFMKYNSYLASPVKETREFVMGYIEDCCSTAKELNCGMVQAGTALQGSKLEESRDAVKERLIDGLRKACEAASRYDIMIVIEPLNRFDGPLIHTFDEAVKIINAVAAPNLGLMGDLFHMNIEERSIENSIRSGVGLLKYLHMNDSNRLAPGEGHLDFIEIFKALRAIAYDGYMTVEILPEPTPDQALSGALAYLQKLRDQMSA